jgi:hypothetical protein
MFDTENRMPIDVGDRSRVSSSLIAASMLLAASISYALVVLQPGLVSAVDGVWTRTAALANGNPRWVVPALATSIAIGGASLAMLLLSAFVNGVQRAPYLWLSPVLIGFSTLVLSRLHAQLPFMGVSLPLLSSLAGLLLLGGGALVQIRGAACVASGCLLLLMPASALVAGYLARARTASLAWAALDTVSALYLFVLVVTSIGVAIVAFVARPSAARDAFVAAARMQRQLLAAQERARLLELDLNETEQRAAFAERELRTRGGSGRVDTDAFVLLARPPMGRRMAPLAIALTIAAIPLAVYFGVYRPLARRLAAQQAFAAEAARDHVDAMQSLRKRFENERANTLAMLTAANDRIAAARAAAEQARAVETGGTVAAPAATPAATTAAHQPDAAAKANATAVQRKAPVNMKARAIATRHGAKKVSAARAAAKGAKKSAAVAGAKPEADGDDHDASKALNERVNDDPIGGLD